jgi:hypothetical protein
MIVRSYKGWYSLADRATIHSSYMIMHEYWRVSMGKMPKKPRKRMRADMVRSYKWPDEQAAGWGGLENRRGGFPAQNQGQTGLRRQGLAADTSDFSETT